MLESFDSFNIALIVKSHTVELCYIRLLPWNRQKNKPFKRFDCSSLPDFWRKHWSAPSKKVDLIAEYWLLWVHSSLGHIVSAKHKSQKFPLVSCAKCCLTCLIPHTLASMLRAHNMSCNILPLYEMDLLHSAVSMMETRALVRNREADSVTNDRTL